ncbi:ribonuclease H2, subunit C [Xylogone sp. PMI_703]|nr:ribonuclease H2, subunit C [Xylogone sp. PMI_703]
MIAIKEGKSNGKCTPNVLPCRINHNGPVDVSKKYWTPSKMPDGKSTAYFRGRKLVGKTLVLPDGYRGVVLTPTETPKPTTQEPEVIDVDADEPEEEIAGFMEQHASFDGVLVWGHEVGLSEEDTYIKGVEEWIGFAKKIHSYDEELKTESKGI